MSFGEKYLAPLGGIFVLALISIISYLGMQNGIEFGNTGSFILGTAGFVLACSIIAYLALHFILMRDAATRTRILIALLVGGLVGGGVSARIARTTAVRPSYEVAYWEQVRQVCNGTGMPKAAAYAETPGLHPLLYADPRYEPSNQARIPPAWMPATPQQLELVLCLGPDEFEEIEFCPYAGSGGITRYQHTRWLTLRSAQTGEEIDSRRFMGAPPDSCPYSKSTTGSEEYHGSIPDAGSESVQSWLSPYIIQNPPAGG
jgi:hypothetical protein